MNGRSIIAVSLLAVPLLAHHSITAEYDLKKRTTIQGTVAKVEWMNPHATFFIDAPESNGTVTHWEIEIGSPNGLMRNGWSRNSIRQGEQISVVALPAKDGSKHGFGQTFTWPDGRVLSAPGKTLTFSDGGSVTAWGAIDELFFGICDPKICVEVPQKAPAPSKATSRW